MLKIVFNNLRVRKKTYFKAFVGFFLVFILAFVTFIYSTSLNNIYQGELTAAQHENIVRTNVSLLPQDFNVVSNHENVGGITEHARYILFHEMVGTVTSFLIGDRKYNFQNFQGANSDHLLCPDAFRLHEADFDVIPSFFNHRGDILIQNLRTVFIEEFGHDPILYGASHIATIRRVAVSCRFLEFWGISHDNAVGSTLRMSVAISNQFDEDRWEWNFIEQNQRQVWFEFEAEIATVFDYRMNEFFPIADILFCDTFEQFLPNEFVTNYQVDTFISFVSFLEIVETLRFFHEHFSCPTRLLYYGGNVWINYWGQSILERMMFVEGQAVLTERFFSVLTVVVLFAVGIYIAANQYFILQKNKGYFGILKANGMTAKKTFAMYFIELFIVILPSLILGAGVAFAIFILLQYLLGAFFYINLTIGLTTWLMSFGYFSLGALIYSLALAVFGYITVLKKEPAVLLRNH